MPTTLVPGLLVSLKTSVTGNVRYFKSEAESEKITESGESRATWKTERVITDPANHEAAGKARTKARVAITRICINSAFGLLCPEDKAGELEAAVADARKIADEFNDSSTVSTLRVYVITGRVASNDMEAIKAINSEVRDLIEQMADGVARTDVAAIRDAAGRAKQLGNMLSIDAAAKVQIAVDASRSFATEAVKADKDGQPVRVDASVIARIRSASALFMDEDEAPQSMPAPRRRDAAILGME